MIIIIMVKWEVINYIFNSLIIKKGLQIDSETEEINDNIEEEQKNTNQSS